MLCPLESKAGQRARGSLGAESESVWWLALLLLTRTLESNPSFGIWMVGKRGNCVIYSGCRLRLVTPLLPKTHWR